MNRFTWFGLIAGAITAAVAFGVLAFQREIGALRERNAPAPTSLEASSAPLLLSEPKELPDFELTTAAGMPFRRGDLFGKVNIVDFIFTRCATSCPAMTARMSALQARILADPELSRSVRLLSFSVDPGHDTPNTLASYADQHGADPAVWTFATGGGDEVARLSRDGFALGVGVAPESSNESSAHPTGTEVVASAPPDILHSNRFAVVDARGRVRGYFPIRPDREHLEALVRFVRTLIDEGERDGELARPE